LRKCAIEINKKNSTILFLKKKSQYDESMQEYDYSHISVNILSVEPPYWWRR